MPHIDEIEEIFAQVERTGTADVWEVVRSYLGVRHLPGGDTSEVTIELHRRPTGQPCSATWRVLAQDSQGRRAISEPNPDLQAAIETVPWHNFDGGPQGV